MLWAWMRSVYWDNLILRFNRLKYQLNRLKTWKQVNKYSDIEIHMRKYVTFQRFYNECEEYFARRYRDEITQETTQDIFDKLN